MRYSMLAFALFISSTVVAHVGAAAAGVDEHEGHKMHQGSTSITANKTTLNWHVMPANIEPHKPTTITFHLFDGAQKPISEKDLKEVHTKKLHLMVIDPSLSDYHHVHPVPTKNAGEYEVTFTPARAGSYQLWLDAEPQNGQAQILQSSIGVAAKTLAPNAALLPSLQSTVGDYTMKLGLIKPMLVDDGNFVVTRLFHKDGKIADNVLLPLMGAYAHGACFSANGMERLHVHPASKDPVSEKHRGSASQPLLITPTQEGMYKLFVQVNIEGKEHIFPFVLKAEKYKP